MHLVDGRAIAAEIRQAIAEQIEAENLEISLGIVACAPNRETQAYLTLKEKIAATLGITLETEIFSETADTDTLCRAVERASQSYTGVVVQLPLPKHIDTQRVLASIVPKQDVDVFRYQGESTEILPPVIGAIAEIAKRHNFSFAGKSVVIFGSGKLVGQPARFFVETAGGNVTVISPETSPLDRDTATKNADAIILGVGKPNLLTPDMVKPGVVIFDAGASEDGGLLVGDADPEVANVASLFTPVPGGIGPITVAVLFRNLLYAKTK